MTRSAPTTPTFRIVDFIDATDGQRFGMPPIDPRDLDAWGQHAQLVIQQWLISRAYGLGQGSARADDPQLNAVITLGELADAVVGTADLFAEMVEGVRLLLAKHADAPDLALEGITCDCVIAVCNAVIQRLVDRFGERSMPKRTQLH